MMSCFDVSKTTEDTVFGLPHFHVFVLYASAASFSFLGIVLTHRNFTRIALHASDHIQGQL